MSHEGPILFYDGECGLCERSVQWCLRHDRRGVVRFAPLQGSTYAALPLSGKPTDLSTIVLLDERGLHVRSDAWVRLLRALGGPWPLVGGMIAIVPRPVRDGVYHQISRRRRRLGPAPSCDLPGGPAAARFLA